MYLLTLESALSSEISIEPILKKDEAVSLHPFFILTKVVGFKFLRLQIAVA